MARAETACDGLCGYCKIKEPGAIKVQGKGANSLVKGYK